MQTLEKTPKLILAPMATLSHQALRQAIYKFGGCDEYYCEMIHASSLLHGGPFEKFYIMNGPEPEKMVWQLTDSDPEAILKASRIVAQQGGIGIDINMGCPAPEIYRFGAGMAWMNKPLDDTSRMLTSIAEILEHSETSCKRLSVKCRLGEDDFTEEGFFDFIKMLVESGVTQIVLHPRTRKQKYSRPARWSYVQSLKTFCDTTYGKDRISIIGNGDVKDWNSAQTALATSPDVDGIMLARYAVQKPWLFSQLARNFTGDTTASDTTASETTASDTTQTLDLYEFTEEYLSYIREYQPKEFWKTRTQRFFAYFCDNFSFALHLKSKMIHSETHEEQLNHLKEYLEKVPEERFIKI